MVEAGIGRAGTIGEGAGGVAALRTGIGAAGAAGADTGGTSTASITGMSARLFMSQFMSQFNTVLPGLYEGGGDTVVGGAGAGGGAAIGAPPIFGAFMANDPAADGAA